MTRKQYIDFFAVLKSVNTVKGCPNFSFAVAINAQALEKEVKAVEAVHAARVANKEYDDAQLEVIQRYCAKDENEKPLVPEPGKFFIPSQNEDIYKKELDLVYEKFSEARKQQLEFDAAVKKLLEEEITIDLLKITKDDLPLEITPEQVFRLLPMIER